MLARAREVEVKLPGRFKVSPQIAGAIKAVPGVVAVGRRDVMTGSARILAARLILSPI